MANQSAREMLSRFPLRMANGGSVYGNVSAEGGFDQSEIDFVTNLISTGQVTFEDVSTHFGVPLDVVTSTYLDNARYGKDNQTAADLLAAEQRILGEIAEDPSSWDPAKAYNAILESGVTIDEALAAGVKQSTIDAIFTSGAPLPVTAFSTPSTVQSAFESPIYSGQSIEQIRTNAQNYVAGLMADGVIDAAERREVQNIATEIGATFQDMLAAGVDPSILFNVPAKPIPPIIRDPYTPAVVDQFPQTQPEYVPPTVYQPIDFDPSVFAPGEESLDRAFRESAPRTEVTEDIFGKPYLTGFDYAPAASLISATGSGFSWTPPTVTGRPRSLMSTGTLGRYTQGRAAQDLRQLVGGNEEAYQAFAPLLSQTGSYGGGLSRSQLFALMQQQASQQAQQDAANYAQFGTRFGARPAGTTGYSEIAESLGGLNDPMTVRPIDLRYDQFAEGGEVKKPDGYADGGSVPGTDVDPLQQQLLELDRQAMEQELRARQEAPSAEDQATRTESRGMLDRLNQSFFENVTKPVGGSLLDMTVGLGDLGQMGVKYLANKAGIETKPFIPVSQRLQESAGVAGYDPYSPAAVATQILPLARGKQALTAAGGMLPLARGEQALTAAGGMLQRLFPNLGRETAAYGGSELAAAGARELMPDSTAAELLASAVGGMGTDIGSTAITRRMADDIEPPDLPETESARMLDELDRPTSPQPIDPNAKGHALPPELLVEGTGQKAETPVVQSFTPKNKDAVIANIDATIARHPDALTSEQSWKATEAEAFGGDYLPAPPSQAVKYNNDPSLLAAKLDRLTPELKATVDEGFGYVNQIKNLYNSQMATPEMTGRLFMWGILSRGAGPVQQEAAFIDLLDRAQPFIAKSARGEFTESDLSAWGEMVKESLPEGSPARQVTMNANAAGKLLYALSQTAEGTNAPALTLLHKSLADPKVTGPEFRRQFFRLTNNPGIDNKVVSFIGLVGGKDDMLVMDRIQSRHLWDDGRYEGKNIYDGINKGGLSKILVGPRGLMLTEMLENGMGDTVTQAYRMIGRPQDGSIGRMHWETWLIEGNQGVSHSTLQAVRSGTPIGAGVTEGKPGTFSSGMTYRQAIEGPIVEYPLSDGSIVRMTPERQKEFEAFVKSPANGIIPKGFKVTESVSGPWYTRPEVDRRKLDEAARQFENANPDGSLRSGDVRDIQGRGTLSQRRNDFLTAFRRDAINVAKSTRGVSGGSDGRNLGEAAGPYTRGAVGTDGRDGLLTFSPDQNALTQYQSASLSLPVIRQVDSATNAAVYNADMTQAMASNPMGAQVEIKSPEELASARLFRTESGSGFAIKPDGDIVAVFASPNEPRRGSYAMLQAAVQAGGKKLDAFDTYLPDIYERVGFRPVARLPWNDEFAPPNWDKNTFRKYNNGEPDIIFFVHDPEYFGGATDVPVVTDYEDAVRLQDEALRGREAGQAPGAELSLVESITPEQRDAWRNANKGDFRQTQTPELADAARDLDAGKISIEDYAQKVKELRPIELITEVPKISSFEEMAYALDKNKVEKGLIGLNKEIPDGTLVGSRLDIPAYNNYDTWVVSVHEGTGVSGKSMGYGKVAVLDDVKFNSNPDAALGVATGKKDKAPFARMNGKWRNMDVEEARSLAEQYLNDPEWTQVGMNPYRHSFFYDKNTGMPVDTAEQVIQIGPLVLAKKATTRPLRSPEHMLRGSTAENPKYFKRGGNVERMTNDNRKYI